MSVEPLNVWTWIMMSPSFGYEVASLYKQGISFVKGMAKIAILINTLKHHSNLSVEVWFSITLVLVVLVLQTHCFRVYKFTIDPLVRNLVSTQ